MGGYQSKEEYYFSKYLDDLKYEGLVVSYEYEPTPFVLCDSYYTNWTEQKTDKSKPKDKQIEEIYSTIYTCDFKVVWDSKSEGIITYTDNSKYKKSPRGLIYMDNNNTSYIEIKPNYDFKNMTRYIKIKVAWVYSKYNIYVQIVKPFSLFKKTFYPDEYKYTYKDRKWRTSKGNEVRHQLTFINKYLTDASNYRKKD